MKDRPFSLCRRRLAVCIYCLWGWGLGSAEAFQWPQDAGSGSISAPLILSTEVHSSPWFMLRCLSDLLWPKFNSLHHQKLDRQFFCWVCFLPSYLVASADASVWQEPNQHKQWRAAILAYCLLKLQPHYAFGGLLNTTAEEAAVLLAKQKNIQTSLWRKSVIYEYILLYIFSYFSSCKIHLKHTH